MNNKNLFKRLHDITVDVAAVLLAVHLAGDYFASNGQHFWSLVAAMVLLLLAIPYLLTNTILLLMTLLDEGRKYVALLVDDED